jgi:hypothetical protein
MNHDDPREPEEPQSPKDDVDDLFIDLGGRRLMLDATVRLLAEENKRLKEQRDALLAACKAALAWRNGPEGPDVMFEEGTAMMEQVRQAVANAKGIR